MPDHILPARATILYTSAEIQAAIQKMSLRIRERFSLDEKLHVIILLQGALFFATDLLRLLPHECQIYCVRISSYGDTHQSRGIISGLKNIPTLKGEKVLILDDVIDTGLTLQACRQNCLDKGASEVITAVAVDKAECRRCHYQADYVALHAGSQYIIGYGLDDAELYRNLPDIYQLPSGA